MKTIQEIFDIVKNHLLTQNERSRYGSVCAYRGLNGLKCAVGCLIADEYYYPELDENGGMIASTSSVVDALKLCGVDAEDEDIIDMLCDLQSLHDNKNPENWAKALKDVAACHDVIY